MANYCPECGHPIHQDDTDPVAAEITAVEEATRADIEIERIRADKEIRLAKINAGIAENEILVEAAVETAHAEGEADGLREAITPPEMPNPETPPIIAIDNEPVNETDELTPPPVEHEAHHTPVKKPGLGLW